MDSSITYREIFSFIARFMRQQLGAFSLIFILDFLAWPIDAVLWPYIIHWIIDLFTQYDSERMLAWKALQEPIFLGLGLVIYIECASRIMGFLMAKGVPKLQASLRIAMFDHIQRHSPNYFNERFSGSLSSKINDMTSQVEAILQKLFWPIIPAIGSSFFGALFFWFINPLFSWMLLGWIFVHISGCFYFAKQCDHYEHIHSEARSSLMGKIVDSFTNNFAVNLFYRFNEERRRLEPFQEEEKKRAIEATIYVEKMRCYLSFFYFLFVIIGTFGSLIYLWMHNKITTGQVIQVFTTMWSLTSILWSVGSSLPTIFQSFGTLKQAYKVMRDPQDINDKKEAKPLIITKGEIVFDRVFFQYNGSKLFENKTIKIEGGEKVGLVGYTGAGKSTFIHLILRCFPLLKGRILIDNQDISEVILGSLREQIALIPQDPLLFHRSLKENIAFGKKGATEEEILQAAKLSHADEFIRKLPNGYESKVGERGTKLSGGEKQRIAIARALLADCPILILDEATSSLDSLTEANIQESLDHIMNNRTVLVIAHRLSTLSKMDRLLVFDKGKIVEEGHHQSLLEQEGLYAKMWKTQVQIIGV